MEYKVGDTILENYMVGDVKRGGFGVVYIVYHRQKRRALAVKSFQDKYFYQGDKAADEVVQGFHREGEVWVKLGSHENIVEAFFVLVIEYKPHIFMEYVDGGSLRQTLLRERLGVPDALFFGIQFCDGMTYANSVDLDGGRRGIVHRDVKPENLMLTREGVLKITDFGLVRALGGAVVEGVPAGTRPYMSPEQFETMDVDTRSDVCSFGVVLYEMLTGQLPFKGPKFAYRHVYEIPAPPQRLNSSIPSELGKMVLRCLEKGPDDRYQSFESLRDDLAEVYTSRFGDIPEVKKRMSKVTVARLATRGMSFTGLGKHEEAITYFDKALETNPRYAWAWLYKGTSLTALGRWREAMTCYDRALEINPADAQAWVGKGNSLGTLLRHKEALTCYDRALEINPRHLGALSSKGMLLWRQGKHREAIPFFDMLLEVDPRQVAAWFGKGVSMARLGVHEEAIACFDKALEINPRRALTWCSKGTSLATLGRHEPALTCYDRSLQINPKNALTWYSKGVSLNKLGRNREARECMRKAIEIDPRLRQI